MTMTMKRTIIEKATEGHPDQVVIEEQINPNDQPNVLAYRVSQLESAVREGFKEHNRKLDELGVNFVTNKELFELKEQADAEHKQIWEAINGIKASAKWWIATIIAASAALSGLVYTISQVAHK